MNLQFLWDEEKTRHLHKLQLYTNITGAVFASLYGVFSPPSSPGRLALIIIPLPVFVFATINLFLLKRSHQGLRLLILILFEQLIAVSLMAATGGFNSIISFAPFVLLFFTIFQLGPTASILVGTFTLPLLAGMQVWLQIVENVPISLPSFLFYVGCFVVAVIALHNAGKEVSLQFEAKKKLERVDELKNQFIALSSHHLRTPLTIIKNYTYQLQKADNDESPEDRMKALNAIAISTTELDRLTEKLMTIASIEKGESKINPLPANLNELLEDLVKSFQDQAKAKGVSLTYEKLNRIPIFPFDAVRIKEALGNILDNAIKFNKLRGYVKVLLNQLNQQDDRIIVQVSDSGQGIPREHLETIFLPFNRGSMDKTLQVDQPGIGLGLYLAKLIVEAHGGKTTVESEEGQGSTFTVTLPLNSPKTKKEVPDALTV